MAQGMTWRTLPVIAAIACGLCAGSDSRLSPDLANATIPPTRRIQVIVQFRATPDWTGVRRTLPDLTLLTKLGPTTGLVSLPAGDLARLASVPSVKYVSSDRQVRAMPVLVSGDPED
jgi:hypothetical protein